jgi:hypothetical protein
MGGMYDNEVMIAERQGQMERASKANGKRC